MNEYIIVPILPLNNVVLFPNMELPLHIFEDRYKHMVNWCLENAREFGVVYTDQKGMKVVGCTAEIVEVTKRFEDGKINIITVGKDRFRILELIDSKPYQQCKIEIMEDQNPYGSYAKSHNAWELFIKIQKLIRSEKFSEEELESTRENFLTLSFFLIAHSSFTNVTKQEFLESLSEEERLDKIINIYKEAIPQLEKIRLIQKKIRNNGFF